MSLTGILDLLGEDRAVSEVLRLAREGEEALVDLTGHAALSTTSIPAGAQSIVATYSGDTDYDTVSSPGLPETVTKPRLLGCLYWR